jgi:hypothetical protein
MPIASDFSLNYTTKKISHASGTDRYTVNEFYSWLMDLFDDASQMDDVVPIKANTPTEYELVNGWEFNADADLGYLYGGSIVVNKQGGNDVWANFYTLGTIAAGAVVYWQQGTSLVASHPGYADGHIDQLIKVVAGGTPTSDRKVTAYIRNLGYLYDHFEVTATATGGRNPVPLATANDLNDDESGGTVAGVTVSFGAVQKDIGDGSNDKPYGVVIDGGGNSMAEVYARLKYLTRRENTTAIDDPENTTEGRFYQTVDPAYPLVKQAPFGTFAGGKFFGAQGVWVENVSDPMNRQLIDANGDTRIPPTSISVSVSSVESGDRILVVKANSGAVIKDQFTIASVTSNTIVATVPIPADVPASGSIRVGDTRFTYTGKSGSTFTGVSPNPTGQTGAFFVPLIDDTASSTSITAGTMIYVSSFEVLARVRKKGIIPFEQTGLTVTNAGLTISAIRTVDSIVG